MGEPEDREPNYPPEVMAVFEALDRIEAAGVDCYRAREDLAVLAAALDRAERERDLWRGRALGSAKHRGDLGDALAAERVRGDRAEAVLMMLADPSDPDSPPIAAAVDYFIGTADPEGGPTDG